MNAVLEVCAGCIESVSAARRGGAYRVELCSGLDEGGVTPSAGFVRAALEEPGIYKHVLVRPRGGDFLYTAREQQVICQDIETLRQMGVDGIVVGALTSEGEIDMEAMKQFMMASEGIPVTFHRAFDMCRNPERALEQIIELGCSRLLTSGLSSTAEAGIAKLRSLNEQAAGRMVIMPGCGVNAQNAAKIIAETGVREIHASARLRVESSMTFRNVGVEMGKAGADEYSRMMTSESVVRAIVQQL